MSNLINPPPTQSPVIKKNNLPSMANAVFSKDQRKEMLVQDMLNKDWQEFFSSVYFSVTYLQQSGTTAERPTKGLYIGRPYYDTTLGYQICVNSVNPTVWHNGAGAVV
jgi:hypothetical protein